ncbi:MAG: c-type cytochrome [Rhodobacteraceae bacterium]|nr:c-type cytochrome [Paracoccaceae bacterium]
MKKITKLAAIAALSSQLAAPVWASETEVVYKFYCAQCHGLTGDGDGPNVTEDFPVTPRKFADATEMAKLTDADIRNVIMDGGPAVSKSPMMPPWGKTLTEDEVTGLIGYLRVLCACEGP